MFNIAIKIVFFFLNHTLLALITLYMELQCFERLDKVKFKSWKVTRVSAEQLIIIYDKRHTIAHVLDRFFLTAGVILHFFN